MDFREETGLEDTSENAVKWYESAVFYHIYPLGMCGALTINLGKRCMAA